MSDHLNRRVTKLEEKVSHLERTNTPRQEEVKTDDPEENSSDKRESTEGQPSLSPEVRPTPITKDQSRRRWYNSLQWWKEKPFTWWRDGLEFIAIFAGVGYAIITYFQWRDLRHNFEVEQRAWIRIRPDTPGNITEKTIITDWPVTIDNIGKSAALRIFGDGRLEVVAKDKAPSFDFAVDHATIATAVSFPTEQTKFPVGFQPINNPKTQMC